MYEKKSNPPDTTYRLSAEQKKRFSEWLYEKTPSLPKCAVCRGRDWFIPDELLEVRPYQNGHLKLGVPTYVFVGVACKNCGNTNFINAVASGVLDSGLREEEKAPTEKDMASKGEPDGD